MKALPPNDQSSFILRIVLSDILLLTLEASATLSCFLPATAPPCTVVETFTLVLPPPATPPPATTVAPDCTDPPIAVLDPATPCIEAAAPTGETDMDVDCIGGLTTTCALAGDDMF